MKGILYGKFLLNRTWIMVSGLIAVFGTALCAGCIVLFPGTNSGFLSVLFIGIQLVALAVMTEWLGRDLEANIKCRFTDMTLAGGISKNKYVLTELIKNLLTIALGLAVCLLMQLIMGAFDNSFLTLEGFKNLSLFALFVGAFEFALNPLIINLKSAEKAGLLFGLVLGFGIVCPVLAISKALEFDLGLALLRIIKSSWFAPGVVGFSAAIYAIFYFVLLHRVKKGDVC